jgi:homopolymeric O-antigen transport system permease protein
MTTYLATVWRFRHFWLSLVRMDLRTRYRRSLLGVGWSLLQPLAMTAIFTVVFQYLMRIGGDQHISPGEYISNALTGLVCWNFVTACAVAGCHCFLLGESYIRQCPLPLAVYPLRTAIGALFHLAMGLVVVTCLCTIMRGFPGLPAVLSLLPSMLILFVFGWSLAVLGGSANVFFQDTQHLAEVGFQIGFYLSPIIWTMDMAAGKAPFWLLQLNPSVPFLALIRYPLLHGTVPPVTEYFYSLAVALAAATTASVLLGRLQKRLIFYL